MFESFKIDLACWKVIALVWPAVHYMEANKGPDLIGSHCLISVLGPDVKPLILPIKRGVVIHHIILLQNLQARLANKVTKFTRICLWKKKGQYDSTHCLSYKTSLFLFAFLFTLVTISQQSPLFMDGASWNWAVVWEMWWHPLPNHLIMSQLQLQTMCLANKHTSYIARKETQPSHKLCDCLLSSLPTSQLQNPICCAECYLTFPLWTKGGKTPAEFYLYRP